MGKKEGREKGKTIKAEKKGQKKEKIQARSLERFLAATAEELIMAINELPDGIILEVYFKDESH